MKAYLPFLIALLAVSCSPKGAKDAPPPAKRPRLEERSDGLTYEVGAQSPFAGAIAFQFPDGRNKREAAYSDGRLDGPQRRWFPNGQVKLQFDYTDGKKVRHREWFESGQIKIDAEMRDGVAFGRHRKWFEDGSVRFDGAFGEGFKWHGHIRDFKPDGTPIWDAEFDNGRYLSGLRPTEAEIEEIQRAEEKSSKDPKT